MAYQKMETARLHEGSSTRVFVPGQLNTEQRLLLLFQQAQWCSVKQTEQRTVLSLRSDRQKGQSVCFSEQTTRNPEKFMTPPGPASPVSRLLPQRLLKFE